MSFVGTRVEDCELPKAWSIGRLDEVCHMMKQGKILPRKKFTKPDPILSLAQTDASVTAKTTFLKNNAF